MNTSKMQRGAALLTGLIFLTLLSIVAAVVMENTRLDLKMSANYAQKEQSFEISEGARMLTGRALDEHVYNRGWPDTQAGGTIPAGEFQAYIPTDMTILDKDNDGAADIHFINNSDAGLLLTPQYLDSDVRRCLVDANGDGDCDDINDVGAGVSIYRTRVSPAVGSGTAQVAGYEGIGVGTAGRGSFMWFELRSLGKAPGHARSVTVAEYRHVIRR